MGNGAFWLDGEVALADWNHMIPVNLTGVFQCTQAVLPGTRVRQHGTISNIASRAGRLGVPRLARSARTCLPSGGKTPSGRKPNSPRKW